MVDMVGFQENGWYGWFSREWLIWLVFKRMVDIVGFHENGWYGWFLREWLIWLVCKRIFDMVGFQENVWPKYNAERVLYTLDWETPGGEIF